VDAAGEWLLDLERAIDADVVHVNGFSHGALAWRAPAIVVAHSCVCSWWRAVHREPAPPAWSEYRARVELGLRAAGMVIAPTHAMRRALEVEYGPIDARVIWNGRSCVTRDASVASAKGAYVLAAGRLWDRAKNIQSLCAAAASLSWPVFVAGDTRGPADASAELKCVQALGHLSPDALQTWMAGAAIYASPARYEPFGLSVLEAAAAGCVLVLGEIDSLRELWNGAAMFVPPDDSVALGAAIEALIAEVDVRARLGALAQARARRFTVERMADAYVETYAGVIAGRQRICS